MEQSVAAHHDFSRLKTFLTHFILAKHTIEICMEIESALFRRGNGTGFMELKTTSPRYSTGANHTSGHKLLVVYTMPTQLGQTIGTLCCTVKSFFFLFFLGGRGSSLLSNSVTFR